MPPITLTPALSHEAPALDALADLVAASAGFRRLNNDRTAEQSLEKVLICKRIDPWDGDSVDRPDPKLVIEQLEELLIMAWLQPQDDEGYLATEDPDAVVSCPREGGTFDFAICRQILGEEWEEHGPDVLYLWFLDCTTSIAHAILETAIVAGTVIRSVRRNGRPKWNDSTEVSAQGRNLYVDFSIDWGDRGGGE